MGLIRRYFTRVKYGLVGSILGWAPTYGVALIVVYGDSNDIPAVSDIGEVGRIVAGLAAVLGFVAGYGVAIDVQEASRGDGEVDGGDGGKAKDPTAEAPTLTVTLKSPQKWVLDPSGGASAPRTKFRTQERAAEVGSRILNRQGGGELAIKGPDGKVREQRTVPPRDPRFSSVLLDLMKRSACRIVGVIIGGVAGTGGLSPGQMGSLNSWLKGVIIGVAVGFIIGAILDRGGPYGEGDESDFGY